MAVQQPSSGIWETKFTFRWMINNFSKLYTRNDYISPNFRSPEILNVQWYLHFRSDPDGSYYNTFIGLCKAGALQNITVNFSIYLSDRHGNDFKTFTSGRYTFSRNDSKWGLKMKMEEIASKIKTHDDILVVLCEIKIFQDNMSEIEHKLKSVQLSCLNDFQALLKDNQFTDLVIKTSDEKELKAHKVILAARTPVFAAMFMNDMSEKRNNEVSISDIDVETMESLLIFIYGGTIGKAELTLEAKKKLLFAAHKYNLETVQSLIEEYLIDDINISNAVGLLIDADMYKCNKLKKCLLKFMCSHEAKAILSTPEWNSMISGHPQILNECYQELFLKNIHFDSIL